MSYNRVCIVCLPRTGSQWCLKMLEEHNQAADLNEYFEEWNQSEYKLTDNQVRLENFTGKKFQPFNITVDYKQRLELLKQADITQPINLRLFLMDHYPKEVLQEIVSTLHELNFTFIAITRDITDQLLSYLIAFTYNIRYNVNIFGINNTADMEVNVGFNHVIGTLDQLYKSSNNFMGNLIEVFDDIPITILEYENLEKNLSVILGNDIRYKGNKTIEVDPLSLIINQNDVRYYFRYRFNLEI